MQDSDGASSRVLITHVVLNSNGDIMASYDKTHLFDVDFGGQESLKESNYVKPGASLNPPVPTPVGKVGLAIVSFVLNLIWLHTRRIHYMHAVANLMWQYTKIR